MTVGICLVGLVIVTVTISIKFENIQDIHSLRICSIYYNNITLILGFQPTKKCLQKNVFLRNNSVVGLRCYLILNVKLNYLSVTYFFQQQML